MMLRRRGWRLWLRSCPPLAGSERPSGPPRSGLWDAVGLLESSGLAAPAGVTAAEPPPPPRSRTLGVLRLSAPRSAPGRAGGVLGLNSDSAAAGSRGGLGGGGPAGSAPPVDGLRGVGGVLRGVGGVRREVGGVAGGGAVGGGGGTRGPKAGEDNLFRSCRSGDLTRLRTRSRTRLPCWARGVAAAAPCRWLSMMTESVGLRCSRRRALACSTIGETRMSAAAGGAEVRELRAAAGLAGARAAACGGAAAGAVLGAGTGAALGADVGAPAAAELCAEAATVREPVDSGLAARPAPGWRPGLAVSPPVGTEERSAPRGGGRLRDTAARLDTPFSLGSFWPLTPEDPLPMDGFRLRGAPVAVASPEAVLLGTETFP